MQLYLSLNAMPELRHRSRKERRQALWQMGLKPYRHWQVWAAMAVAGAVVLWALDTFLGNMLMYPELGNSNKGFAAALTVLLIFCIPAVFACRHAYLKALRPYLARASFDPAGSWWGAAFKGLLVDLVSVLLLIACVGGIDWAINSYDEKPDPRIAAIQNWPEPIPDSNNGFIAAIGLQAPQGTPPFAAGQRWVAAVNDAVLKHAQEFPKAPEGLKYTAYVAPVPAATPQNPKPKTSPERTGSTARFCDAGTSNCLKIVREEQNAVETWVAANQELLARYLSLQKYLQWQYAIKQGDAYTPIPPLAGLMRAQALMHAAALLAIEKGHTAKGLEMMGDDIRFVRNMLASKDALIGKMIATSMLSKDLAVMAEIIGERPNELKPHWAQIEKMLEPLSPAQVSAADAFRFEERWILAFINMAPLSQAGIDIPLLNNAWTDHHYKRAATSNLMLRFWDQVIQRTEVRDATYTPPAHIENVPELLGISRVTGFMHNQGGKTLTLVAVPDYAGYSNRAYDLNALSNLVRLRLALAKNSVSAKDVPALLDKGDKTLWNPETGKPFEWDAERRQVYFIPATDNFKSRFNLGSGVSGRVGFVVAERAAPEPAAKVQAGKAK